MPAASSALNFSRNRINRAGGAPVLKCSFGVGSNENTSDGNDCVAALSSRRRRINWWPKCNPSKTPMLAAQPGSNDWRESPGLRIRFMLIRVTDSAAPSAYCNNVADKRDAKSKGDQFASISAERRMAGEKSANGQRLFAGTRLNSASINHAERSKDLTRKSAGRTPTANSTAT